MNPFTFVLRRPITTLVLVAGMITVGILVMEKMGIDVLPGIDGPKVDSILKYVVVGAESKTGGHEAKGPNNGEAKEEREEAHKIIVTSPEAKDVTIKQPYVCQIHSQTHIEVRALEDGYIEQIFVVEGQAVKKGDPMFKIVATLYEAEANAEIAEASLAQLEYNNTKRLVDNNVVSQNELMLLQARLAKAQAKADLAKAKLGFTNVTARFDGIIDRLHHQQGSLVDKGDILTTLSDNSLMWVYFNVPERDYLEYMASLGQHKDERPIELKLANGETFKSLGTIGAIEAKFNNKTGNIPFRADFKNPEGLLRHGQTGTVLLPLVAKGALVIPQRATFEILDKRFVYVVDKDDVAHQREIAIQIGMDDIYVMKKGLDVTDKIVLEGGRQLHDGEKIEYEFHRPEDVMKALKNRAE